MHVCYVLCCGIVCGCFRAYLTPHPLCPLCLRILHFIYDNFLATYVHPNGRLQPNAVEVFDLQLRVWP